MPKKIVLRIKPSPQKPETSPDIEVVPPPPQQEEQPVKEVSLKPVEEPVQQQPVGDELDEALKMYDELMREIERLRGLDRNFMLYCIKMEELRPQLVRNILSRLAEKRNALLEKSGEVLERLRAAKEALGSEFAQVEEELIWSSIELNTMQLEKDSGSDKGVGIREELEAKIPELRKKLASLRNRLKMVEEMVKQLSDLPRNIADITTNKEEPAKLFEEIKKKYILSHGQRAEAVARAEIEKIAQQESIPREYAVILLWKSLANR
ncbi:MAG: hypothetical protein QXS96_06700 [Candidatus Caldarchaeum sp.]